MYISRHTFQGVFRPCSGQRTSPAQSGSDCAQKGMSTDVRGLFVKLRQSNSKNSFASRGAFEVMKPFQSYRAQCHSLPNDIASVEDHGSQLLFRGKYSQNKV